MAETNPSPSTRFVFPRWANYLLPVIILSVFGGMTYLPVAMAYGLGPGTLAVGYSPTQPVPYSHALHVGKLGLDCRYCHNTVEKTAFAPLPATQTCMNCHTNIKNPNTAPKPMTDEDRKKLIGALNASPLKPVLDSWESGQSVPWIKIHNLANYVYFNHSAHVSHGVGCVECHGRIDRMDVVEQVKPLNMGWCLDCHRNPGPHLRPKDVAVTDMNWTRDEKTPSPDELVKSYGIRDVAYMQSCYTCHR